MKRGSIDVNPEFKRAIDIMERSKGHVFITGKAGTGKSTLLDYFRRNTHKEVAVLAPTGVAALNVQGQTIHFLRLQAEYHSGQGEEGLGTGWGHLPGIRHDHYR